MSATLNHRTPASSTSSKPSATTSSTLNSGRSSLDPEQIQNHGESSTTPWRRSWNSHDPRSLNAPVQRKSHQWNRASSDSYGAITSLARRRFTPRNSSGFLLEPISNHFKTRRRSGEVHETQNDRSDRKGKRRAGAEDGPGVDNSFSQYQEDETLSAGGPPRLLNNGVQTHSTFQGYDNRFGTFGEHSNISSHSSTTPSDILEGMSSGQQMHGIDFPTHEGKNALSGASVIDPTQLVRMALSLSESRRLHLNPGQLPGPATSGSRRVMSIGLPIASAALQGSYQLYGGSLGRNLHGHRRSSRNASPKATNSVGQQATTASPTFELAGGEQDAAVPRFGGVHDFQFSTSTLTRADKARRYIELSLEYKRMLQFLPALKPQSSHKENSRHVASSIIGSNRAFPDDFPYRDLGRTYNPLQYIRNRRVRARERVMLDSEAAGWNDVASVRAWVDAIENGAKHPGYRVGDIALLPDWHMPVRTLAEQNPSPQSPSDRNRHDASSNPNKLKGTKLDWTITPADLLADAYWLERGNHKALIESKAGNKIFERFQRPTDNRRSMQATRQSFESQVGIHTENDDSPESAKNSKSPDSFVTQGSDVDHDPDFDTRAFSNSESRVARVRRRLFRRSRATSNGSDLSASDKDDTHGNRSNHRMYTGGENTAPLGKHMNKILEIESRSRSRHSLQSLSLDQWDHSWDQKYTPRPEEPTEGGPKFQNFRDSTDTRRSATTYHTGTPRISVEDVDSARAVVNGYANSLLHGEAKGDEHDKVLFKKSKAMKLNLFRQHKSKEQNHIAENDFALNGHLTSSGLKDSELLNSTLESSARTDSASSQASSKSRIHAHSKGQDDSENNSDHKASVSTTKRFFKAGRIGEIVREGKPRVEDFMWKQTSHHRNESVSSSKSGTASSSGKNDSSAPSLALKQQASQEPRPQLQGLRGRSQSANDLKANNYHIKNLPSFTPARMLETQDHKETTPSPYEDRTAQQRQGKNDELRKSRFERLGLPGVYADSSEVSPHTASPDLSRHDTRVTPSVLDAHLNSYNFPHLDRSTSRSRSAGIRSADLRLQAILSQPGGVIRDPGAMSGLANLDNGNRGIRRSGTGHRRWNIVDSSRSPQRSALTSVTHKEIAYVRSLLLSAGVKAKGIQCHADEVASPVPDFLVQAAAISHATLTPVPRQKEHVLAAQLLSSNLESTVAAFEEAADKFRSITCHRLHSQVDELRENVVAKLTPQARTQGDEADAFIARLTMQHTLAVKQVNDGVDIMLRKRRRRLRVLRMVGWRVVEWAVVGLMWCIWLFVLMLRALRVTIMGTVRGIKWLLWI